MCTFPDFFSAVFRCSPLHVGPRPPASQPMERSEVQEQAKQTSGVVRRMGLAIIVLATIVLAVSIVAGVCGAGLCGSDPTPPSPPPSSPPFSPPTSDEEIKAALTSRPGEAFILTCRQAKEFGLCQASPVCDGACVEVVLSFCHETCPATSESYTNTTDVELGPSDVDNLLPIPIERMNTEMLSAIEAGTSSIYCGNQCRWYHGFFDRSIEGTPGPGTAGSGGLSPRWCRCNRQGTALPRVPYMTTDHPKKGPPTVPPSWLPNAQCFAAGCVSPITNCTPTTILGQPVCSSITYKYAKPFDPDYWADEYSTEYLCILGNNEKFPKSVSKREVMAKCGQADAEQEHSECQKAKAEIESDGSKVLHCGKCSSCSTFHDMAVMNKTKTTITSHMTACSAKWSLGLLDFPRFPPDSASLIKCLREKGIDFTEDSAEAWEDPANKPSCMQTWVDNIVNDKMLCMWHCLTKFIKTKNSGDFARDQCLQCDEYTSGPAFIKGAGANRRSTGIRSDIKRTQLDGTEWVEKICPIGFYSQPPPALPEASSICITNHVS